MCLQLPPPPNLPLFPPGKHRNRVVDRSTLDAFECGHQHGVGLLGQDSEGQAPCLFVNQEITGMQRAVQVAIASGRSRCQVMRRKLRASYWVK
ncbi:MAG: hypothetical protein WBO95_12310 [Candidatus Dechloromonas phosphoritropha]|jgi:hypothetical protein